MTAVEAPTTETFPWDKEDQPSAVYQAHDRVQATMFLRPTTPVEAFDRDYPEGVGRVIGIRVGDITFQFGLGEEQDATLITSATNIIRALDELREAAQERTSR